MVSLVRYPGMPFRWTDCLDRIQKDVEAGVKPQKNKTNKEYVSQCLIENLKF